MKEIAHPFSVDKTYQENLRQLLKALESMNDYHHRSDLLALIKQQSMTKSSYFANSHLKKRETIWTLLLYTGTQLHLYQKTTAEGEEKNYLHQVVQLLKKLWEDTRAFNEEDQKQLSSSINQWLATSSFGGQQHVLRDLLQTLSILSYSLNIFLASLSRLEKAFLSQSMKELFATIIQCGPIVASHYQSLLREHPELINADEIPFNYQNAGDFLAQKVKEAIRALDDKSHRLNKFAGSFSQQLPILRNLTQSFNEKKQCTVRGFFTEIPSDEHLLSILEALNIPKSEHHAWITTYHSYKTSSWSLSMQYYMSGVSLTPHKIAQYINDALDKAVQTLLIAMPEEELSLADKVILLDKSIQDKIYLTEIKTQRAQLVTIAQSSQVLNFTPPEVHFKKRRTFSLSFSKKNMIKQKFSAITFELSASKKQLEVSHDSLTTWVKEVKRLGEKLGTPHLSEAQQASFQSIYKQAIQAACRCFSLELTREDDPRLLLDILLEKFQQKIEAVSQNLDVFEQLITRFIQLDAASLQHLVCFMAAVDEEDIASFSESFTNIRAKLFYCVANAWDDQKGVFTRIDIIFNKLSEELRRQDKRQPSLSSERMFFFAEKITSHNQRLSEERSLSQCSK